ncbi:MAG: 4-hydroxy-tetrahydrodipicolinate reductase [Acutalibacteraceae bacterium]|nr:4-hydroxy-tetrahydrodipicolinate reductase [Acutalibacteraceae bacterium]
MIKVLINGACGRMGKEVEKIVEASETMTVAAKVDKMAAESGCYTDINDFSGEADIIIDFSNHLGTKDLLDYAVKNNIPTVVATTGHTPEELALIEEAGKKIAVFHSANMSLGVALLCELAVKAAATMPDADIEIVETHHNRKLDAPSGTALMIANAIKAVREKAQFVFGREGMAKREKNEIGVHAVRRGNIVGIHEVLVSTDSQTITLKHEAHSRALFAEGAVSAAEFILGKPAGLYNMNSIVTE